MKMCAYVSLMLGILVVFFSVSALNGAGTLGMSDYNVHETVHAGYAKTFAVGRVFNEGDAPLSISALWVQSYGDVTLSVTVEPQTKILDPYKNYQVFVTVHKDSVAGSYGGTVEVEATSLEHGSGNPVVGAREARVQVTVVGVPPPETTEPEETPSDGDEEAKAVSLPKFIPLAIIALSSSIVAVYFLVKRFRGREVE